MTAVGFEPTPPERLEPKSSALDHSATLPMVGIILKFERIKNIGTEPGSLNSFQMFKIFKLGWLPNY